MSPLRLFRELVANPVQLRTELFAKYGDIISIKFGRTESIVVAHPELIGEMLGERETNFMYRAELITEGLAPAVGKNVGVLINNNLPRWIRERRTTLMAVDERSHFRSYAETMATCMAAHLDRWPRQYGDDAEIDIETEIDTVAVEIMCNTVFCDMGIAAPQLRDLMWDLTDAINARSLDPFLWMRPKARARHQRAIDRGRQVARGIVRRRLDEDLDYDDLIGNLLHHTDETDRETLIDEVARQSQVLLSAGLFTTSTVVHWAMLLLSRFPEHERRMAAEIEEQLGDRPPRLDDVDALRFTRAFLKEELRMYPVTLNIERRSAEDGELSGYRVPRKTDVIASIYHIHRHPDFWVNPEGFDPQRFIDRPLGQDYPYAYVPFGGGRRSCIGRSFGLLQATIMVVMLVQRVRLSLRPGAVIGQAFPTIVSMRPDVSTMKLRYKHGWIAASRPPISAD